MWRITDDAYFFLSMHSNGHDKTHTHTLRSLMLKVHSILGHNVAPNDIIEVSIHIDRNKKKQTNTTKLRDHEYRQGTHSPI